ncbi:MAG: SIS domain-containing protein [Patescibacteria group bacterium]|nr:SIS domain-containing protein [Patescibacteria group bacterium]
MNTKILDSLDDIRKLDGSGMLDSLELLPAQVEEIVQSASKLRFPVGYKRAKNIVVAGMGGSALGAHIIKSLFFKELTVPMEIVNGYHLPAYVGKDTFVLLSSYSGATEETISALEAAKAKKAKIAVITSGGRLAKWARATKAPALIFTTANNPCGSPRMGLGYSIVGQLILFAKTGFIRLPAGEINAIIHLFKKFNAEFGVVARQQENIAKRLAIKTVDKTVWFIGAEHLAGNMHTAANQMNENAKRFAGYFLLPELNHHLMEGLLHPKTNKENLLFVLVESDLYDHKIQKRMAITKKVLEKNRIDFVSYKCQEDGAVAQAMEILSWLSYTSFYSALLEKIDPTPIPFVDYFKKEIGK